MGIVLVPYVAHAAYGRADIGQRNTPVSGTVRSLETGGYLAGIRVNATWPHIVRPEEFYVYTDDYGNFELFLPERERYYIHFVDTDGELNGGFFRHKTRAVMLADIPEVLNIKMEGENDVTIHGIVRSAENNEGISGIRLTVNITETDIRYQVLTDDGGHFSIRVPEREVYNISFVDIEDLFRTNTKEFELTNIAAPLNIIMEDENIITIRGRVYSAETGQAADGIRVSLFPLSMGLNQRYVTLTDDEGYFYINIPEREKYTLNFEDRERNRFGWRSETINWSNNNDVLSFELRER